MTIDELKERVKVILDDAIEDRVHSDLESTLHEIIADYNTFQTSDDANFEWQLKYDQLKEKYIERFLHGDPSDFEETETLPPEPPSIDDVDAVDISVEDLFEEKEEEEGE